MITLTEVEFMRKQQQQSLKQAHQSKLTVKINLIIFKFIGTVSNISQSNFVISRFVIEIR